jgi:hypothetical protein
VSIQVVPWLEHYGNGTRAWPSAYALLYAEGLTVGAPPGQGSPAEGMWLPTPRGPSVYPQATAAEPTPRASLHRGERPSAYLRSPLDLTWSHMRYAEGRYAKGRRGRRHRGYTPRAAATPRANTPLPMAVYVEGCRRRRLCRGLLSA